MNNDSFTPQNHEPETQCTAGKHQQAEAWQQDETQQTPEIRKDGEARERPTTQQAPAAQQQPAAANASYLTMQPQMQPQPYPVNGMQPMYYQSVSTTPQANFAGAPGVTKARKPVNIHDPITRTDKISLVCALALALLWSFCVSPIWISTEFVFIGGMAFSGCLLAFLACAWFLRSKTGHDLSKPPMSRWSFVLLGLTVALMCVPGLTQSMWIRPLNTCALAVMLPLTYLSLSGYNGELFSLPAIGRAIGTFLTEQFRNWLFVGKVFSASTKNRKYSMANIATGAVCACAVLTFAIPALSAADERFSQLAEKLLGFLLHLNEPRPIINIARFILVVPIAFSLLYGLRHPAKKTDMRIKPIDVSAPVTTLNTMLGMLDAVYLIFVAVESSYLFGGKEALEGSGGYATYAREGFFQLVAVTAVNLIIVMVCIHLRKGHKRATSLLTLELTLVASTTVMLVSAAWRMSMYIGEYGLSRLRILTIWAWQ